MKSIKPMRLLLAAVVAGGMLCSCVSEAVDEAVDGENVNPQPTLSIGKKSYSFGNAYWSCSESETRANGKYVCDLQFFSFDYYRALSTGRSKSMPERFSFMVFSFETDHKLTSLESVTIPSGKWKMTGAINMPRGEGESDYYLADALNHPNGDLVIERNGDDYVVSVNPVYVDYERGSDKTWFIIESPFVYRGNVKVVPSGF